MHAAGDRAFGGMNLKERSHFLEDLIERAGLVAGHRCDGIAVHRIA